MACIVMQMPWLDYYSFYSLRHFMTDLRCGAHCVCKFASIGFRLWQIVEKMIARTVLNTIQLLPS